MANQLAILFVTFVKKNKTSFRDLTKRYLRKQIFVLKILETDIVKIKRERIKNKNNYYIFLILTI